MSLFGGHYLVDNDILPVRVEEYGVTVRHMHPVAFLGGIETFDVPMCMRMISETIDVFDYDATILFMKASKKVFGTLSYLQMQKIHSVVPSSCFA
ncbi:MAG: hypothetical protein ABSD81_03140 [Methanomicrobiales archaeon]|jgi:hypothetical protein